MADEIRHQEHGEFKTKIEELEDFKYKLQEVDDTVSLHSARIQSLEQWRNGNGARGAEVRLQKVEDAIPEMKADIEVVMRVADAKIESSIEGVLNRREKTVLAYIKAFGPLVSGLAAIALAVYAVVR